jgi:hypothetical protein
MNNNIADAVAAMEKLRKEQAESLTAMNGTFTEAVDAMKSQLATLKAAQRAQLKEQVKHPVFDLYVKTHAGRFSVGSQNFYIPNKPNIFLGGESLYSFRFGEYRQQGCNERQVECDNGK